MKVMVASWGAPTHFYPMVPLAVALRTAGHDVRVVTQPALVPAARRTGLPVLVTRAELDIRSLLGAAPERRGGTEGLVPAPAVCGVGDVEPYVRIAEATAAQTLDIARAWRPDLVMYEPSTYVGPFAAAALGVPAVRHLWGVDYLQRFRPVEPYALAALCARLDLPPVETLGDLTVDCCPPSMQVPAPPGTPQVPRLSIRYRPYNGPALLPGWLVSPPRRPRVCVTWGTTGYSRGPYLETLRRVIGTVAGVDAEVVVTLSAEDAAEVGAVPPNVRMVSMLALNLLLPTCSAIVAQGGLGTMMTAAALGVAQVVIPQAPDHVLNARQLAATGAGHVLPFADATGPAVRAAVEQVLGSAAIARDARALAAEIAAQTSLADAVRRLETLAADAPAPGHRPSSSTVERRPAGRPAPARNRPVRDRPTRDRPPRALVTVPRWSTGTGAAMVPFARALRLAGYEVLVAVTPEYRGPALRSGLPAVVVGRPLDPAAVTRSLFAPPGTARAVEIQVEQGMAGMVGVRSRMALPEADRGAWAQGWRDAYVRGIRAALHASAGLVEDTLAVARSWRPGVVVFGPNGYAGPLAAAVLGVPAVRHLAWADQSTVTGLFEQEALAPLWERYGAGAPDPFGALTVDPCPLALRLYADYPRTGARFVPLDRSRAAAPQPVPAAGARPRVAVAIGSTDGWPDAAAGTAATVLDALAGLDVDVLAAASARDLGGGRLRLPGNARAVPPAALGALLPSCAALVTAGEPDVLLSAVAAACPVLVLPQLPDQALRAHALGRTGGARVLPPSAADPAAIRAAVGALVEDPGYRVPLRRMRADMLAQPPYAEVAAMVRELTG